MKKIINSILIIVMVLFDARYIINSISLNSFDRLPTYLALIPLLFVPKILKLLRFKLSDTLEVMYYVFIFMAQFLGCVVNLYASISWFDTFTHLLSGIFFSIVSLMFIDKNSKITKKNKLFYILYILGFTMLTACIWEFFEFGMDMITGSNLQHAKETGVVDTMQDMIAAFIGSIIFLTFYNIKEKSL